MTKLNYSFTDVELLNTALTHSSFVRGDNRIYPNNERMEFLGDAVLELCASEYLYLNYPKMNEGMMTRTRARTVCESALNIVAKELELGKYLLLSHGEENTGGREKPFPPASPFVPSALSPQASPAHRFRRAFPRNPFQPTSAGAPIAQAILSPQCSMRRTNAAALPAGSLENLRFSREACHRPPHSL